MFDELIKAVQDGVKPNLLEVGGEMFSTQKALHRIPKVPLAKTLDVSTLESVIDYVGKGVDNETELGDVFIHIRDEANVDVVHFLDDENRREVRVTANYRNGSFVFGQMYDQSTFITLLQSQFVANAGREQLQKIVGGLNDESSLHLVDDGIAQKTTAKVGITTSERITTPNPFTLAPFRTFPEIEQPESEFILRLHKTDGAPRISLHESDNQAWKLLAVKSIKEHIAAKLTTITILA